MRQDKLSRSSILLYCAGLIPVVWLALLLCCVCALPALKFHSDVRQFDVSPKTFDEEEKRVSAGFFSGPRPAMLLFQGSYFSSESIL